MGDVTTLQDVCAAIVDCAHKTAPVDESGDYFAVGTPAMRGNRINYAEARRINSQTFETWTERLRPQYGDLLLAREAPVGPVVRIPHEERVAPGQRTVLLRPREAEVDPGFLYYFLVSPARQSQLLAMAEGSTVSHLNVADARMLPIKKLPPLGTQQAIAAVLGALDDKIAANERVVQACDAFADALTLASLDGDEVPLVENADITMGSSPPGSSYNELGEGLPFYQGVRDFGTRSPNRRIWTTDPVRVAEAGDTLVSVRAPVGRTNMASEKMCLGRGIAGLRSAQDTPMTLFHQLRAARSAWAPYEAEGTVFGAINKKQLEQIPVPSVRVTDVESLEQRLVEMEERLAAATRECASLASTRDELLPLLMSGRLRVADAERVVSDAV